MAEYLLINNSNGNVVGTINWDGLIGDWNTSTGFSIANITSGFTINPALDNPNYYLDDFSKSLSGSYDGYSGSFSGSYTGSFSGSYTGSFSGSYTGSFTGSLLGIGSGSFSGSFTGGHLGTGIGAFRGIGSASFIGSVSGNPGTASFWGLASSASLIQVYEASTTTYEWTIPSWAQKVTIICIGGGGAGGKGQVNSATNRIRGGGGGGSGGTLVWATFDASSFNKSVKYQLAVGAGGTGNTDNAQSRNGGTSIFGSFDSATSAGLQVAGQYPALRAFGGIGGQDGQLGAVGGNDETATNGTTSPRYRYYPDMQGPRVHPGGPGGVGGVGKSYASDTTHGGAGVLTVGNSNPSPVFGAYTLDATDLPIPYRSVNSALNTTAGNAITYFNSLFFFRHSAEIAPTGGGGGAGISGSGANINSTTERFEGGRGGAIKSHPNSGWDQQTVTPPVIMERENYRYNTTAPSIPFLYTQVGLGGKGGGTRGSFNGTAPTAGAKYGGGGGGGRALNGVNGFDNYGADGGPGVIVIISEA